MKNNKKYLQDLNRYVFTDIPRATFIYFITCCPIKNKSWHDRVKIGISRDPQKRIRQLQTANSNKLNIWHYFKVPVDESKKLENELHCKFRWSNERGEWFVIHPAVRNWIKAHKKALFEAEKPEIRQYVLRKKQAV